MNLAGCTPDSTAPELRDDDIALNNRGVALMGYFDYVGAYEDKGPELTFRTFSFHSVGV